MNILINELTNIKMEQYFMNILIYEGVMSILNMAFVRHELGMS